MRDHLFQKFFGKIVKIKETSFLSCFVDSLTHTYVHLCPEGMLKLTPPNKFTKFSFFTIKGMECISNLRLAHFVRLKLSFVEK